MEIEDQLRRVLERTAAQIRDEVSRQMTAAEGELTAAVNAAALAQEAAAPPPPPPSQVPVPALAAVERLAGGLDAIDSGRSLTETLDALLACAGREARRVGIFLVRGETFVGWRFVGFDALTDAPEHVVVPLAESGVLADAVRAGAARCSVDRAPAFADLPTGGESLGAPITIAGEAVAVLYADQLGAAGHAPEWVQVIEILARHAARSLEALTAIQAARVLTGRADAPAAGGSAGDMADDGHAAARRYARLLVSEIKLYHEPQVLAGRRDHNLAECLGTEIARARNLYEQRVPADVRQQADYFNAELVRTLADGDASVLGASA